MNIALVLSDAPGFVKTMIRISKALELHGFVVYFFSDSHTVTASYLREAGSSDKLFCFAEYLRKSDGRHANPIKLNKGLFADYERLMVYYNASSKDVERFFERAEYLYSFFNKKINEYNIEALISESPAGSYTEAAYLASDNNKILFIGFELSRVNGLTEIYLNGTPAEINHSQEEKEYCYKVVNNYLNRVNSNSSETPLYMKEDSLISVSNDSFYSRFKNKDRTHRLYNNFIMTIKGHKNYFGFSPLKKDIIHLWFLLRRKFIKLINKAKTTQKITTSKENINVLFALHFHPEASTSMSSQENFNELDILTYICALLPQEFKVYIKEHPSMIGRRSSATKKYFKSLPRSSYIDIGDEIHNYEDIDAVITLTGTMGLEYALRGKPVIAFGEVFFNEHPCVHKVNQKSQCLDVLMSNLSHNQFMESFEENFEFLKNYSKRCITQSFELSMSKPNEVEQFACSISRIIKTYR